MDDRPGYCDHCGGPLTGQGGEAGHGACHLARELDPPRYCGHCGRRTLVKVTPHGWSSRCSRHGLTQSVT